MHSQLPSGMFDNGSVDSRFCFPVIEIAALIFLHCLKMSNNYGIKKIKIG